MLDAYAAGQDGQPRLTLLSTWLGHVHPAGTYWYLSASPELLAVAGQRLETSATSWPVMTALAPTLQAFFTDRLIRQRHASSHTIAAYRDTLRYCSATPPTRPEPRRRRLDLADLDAPMIGAFLDHLEHDRGNSVRTRNARLAAIHSLFRFAALLHPEHAASISRVLAIPPKRCDQALITYLTDERDRRAACRARHWHLDRPTRPRPAATRHPDRAARLRTHRADHRRRPPRRRRARQLPRQRPQRPDHPADHRDHARAARLAQRTHRTRERPLFPGRTGQRLSRDAIEHRIAKHTLTATRECPSLRTKRVTAHVMRHTTAMRLLHAGIDTAVIALWLGHENIETTRIYLFADLELKQRALARTRRLGSSADRYRPSDKLIAWLEAL